MTAEEKALVARVLPLLRHAVRVNDEARRRAGLEADDAVHELLLVFVERLRGKHPFDPSRGSLSHYVHTLVWTVLANAVAKRARRCAALSTLAAHMTQAEQVDTEGMVLRLLDGAGGDASTSVGGGEGSIEPPGFLNSGGVVGAPTAGETHTQGVFSDQEMPTPPPRRRRRAA